MAGKDSKGKDITNYYMDITFITVILLSQKRKERASAVSENPKLTEDLKKKWLSVITLTSYLQKKAVARTRM